MITSRFLSICSGACEHSHLKTEVCNSTEYYIVIYLIDKGYYIIPGLVSLSLLRDQRADLDYGNGPGNGVQLRSDWSIFCTEFTAQKLAKV